jgi:hypothetical protein
VALRIGRPYDEVLQYPPRVLATIIEELSSG